MNRYGWILAATIVGLIAPGCAKAKPITERPHTKTTLTLTVFGKQAVTLARPQTVHLIGRLEPGDDLDDYACAAIQWELPGQQLSLNQTFSNCGVQLVFFKEVHLRAYGEMTPRLSLISPYTDKVLAWAEVHINVFRPEE